MRGINGFADINKVTRIITLFKTVPPFVKTAD
jgi:hypothetical protein